MLDKVKQYINDNKLMEANSKVVFAFSYGVDSRVLLDVLLKLNYEVVLCHVNHKHRPQSELEEKEAYLLAKKYNLKIYVLHLVEDEKKNFHADAHDKRYSFFIETAIKENAKYIATAHHANDNLETVLLNLIRGSNLYGYSGISNKVHLENVTIVRPLLFLSKEEIKNYQKINELDYFEDSSNSEDDFRRNRIRHNVYPLLEKENPNILNNVAHYSSILQEAFKFIRGKSIELYALWNNKIIINGYKVLEKALRHDILSFMLEEASLFRSYNLINNIDNILMSDKPQADISLNDKYLLKKRYNIAFIEKDIQNDSEYYELYEDSHIITKNMRFYFTKILPSNNAKYLKLCYNDIVYPLVLRTRRAGDTIKMSYGHKKIKNLFVDLKLSNEKRDSTLLLINQGDILWVCDYAKSEALKNMKDKGDIYLVYEVRNES